MATIKSYSDLQQSRKLAEILPIESADMYYEEGIGNNYRINFGNYADIDISKNLLHIDAFPCWSLAALLSILHFPSLTQNKEDEWEVCVFDHDNDNYIEKTASNPVDTCVAMIEKLNGLNLL